MEHVKKTLTQNKIVWYISQKKVRLCEIIAGFTPGFYS